MDKSGNLVDGGAVNEARQALTNLGHVLEAAGCSYNHVVKCTLLLADIKDFASVNEVYKEFFKPDYPARYVCLISL
jgi:2-iminobutanoate/2-iminopropanoate deaminase